MPRHCLGTTLVLLWHDLGTSCVTTSVFQVLRPCPGTRCAMRWTCWRWRRARVDGRRFGNGHSPPYTAPASWSLRSSGATPETTAAIKVVFLLRSDHDAATRRLCCYNGALPKGTGAGLSVAFKGPRRIRAAEMSLGANRPIPRLCQSTVSIRTHGFTPKRHYLCMFMPYMACGPYRVDASIARCIRRSARAS